MPVGRHEWTSRCGYECPWIRIKPALEESFYWLYPHDREKEISLSADIILILIIIWSTVIMMLNWIQFMMKPMNYYYFRIPLKEGWWAGESRLFDDQWKDKWMILNYNKSFLVFFILIISRFAPAFSQASDLYSYVREKHGYDLNLINGILYYDKYKNVLNHPFLSGENLLPGSIVFSGIRYEGLKFNYDIYSQYLLPHLLIQRIGWWKRSFTTNALAIISPFIWSRLKGHFCLLKIYKTRWKHSPITHSTTNSIMV